MIASLAESPIEPYAAARIRRPAFSRVGYVLLGAIAVVWIGAAAMAAGGAADAVANLLHAIGYSAAWLISAGVATICLLGMLALDRRAILARDAAREARRVSELFSQILEAFPFGVHIKDADLRYLWINAEHARQTGLVRAVLLGRTPDEIGIDPKLAADVMAHDRCVLASGRTEGPREQVLRGPDGRLVHIAWVTKIPIVENGRTTHIVTVGADLTALKRAQTEADTANRLIEGILNNAPLGILVKDTDLRIRWANHNFAEAVHSTPDALLGKTLEDFDLPADAVARAHELDRSVLATGETIQFAERWVVSGVFRHMMVVKAAILDAGGRTTHVVTIGADVTELHRLRVEADDARRRLQTVLDAVPVTIALKDKDRRFQWVNREFERVAGLTAATVIGRRWEEIVADQAAAEEVVRLDAALLATGNELPPVRREHVSVSGEKRQFFMRRLAVRGVDGGIDSILVVGVDVTDLLRATTELRRMNEELERRVAERASELAKANELVSTVVQSAPVPIVIYGLDGRINVWNPAAASVTGFSEAEARSGLLPDLPSKDQLRFAEMRRLIMRGESFSNFEIRYRHKNGAEIELLASGAPLRRADGTMEAAVGIWLDVTERKQAERELAAARANLLDAIESVNHGIVLYDRDDRIVLFNQLHLDHYREIKDAIKVGMSFEDRFRRIVDHGLITIPDGQDKEAFIAERVALHRRADGRRFLSRNADGRTFEAWENRSRNGGIITIGADMTERMKLEQQLRHAQKMEAIGQLTGGVAHDFNNLLAVVIGNLDLLSPNLPPDRDGRELVREAIEAAERGAALTRRLLAFARRQTLQPIATDISGLLRDMEPLLRRAVGEAIVIEFTATGDPWPALVDPSQLESAILNLSVNARDAMPAGGKLRITTCNAVLGMDHPARHADVAPGDYVCICVSDTGVGIAPEIIDQVFEPFFTTKEIGKGSGLGLSMVFGFVKQSGGQVGIHSELGAGTSITLYLPRAIDTVAGRATDRRIVAGRGETILLVEDNPQLRRTSINAVTTLGYRVLAAGNAETALALLKKHPEISLLFSDVVLPGGTNGFDLAREARRRRPDLAVLFTSGFVDPSMTHDSNLWRDAVILTKPFRRAELAEKLRAGLDPRGGPAI